MTETRANAAAAGVVNLPARPDTGKPAAEAKPANAAENGDAGKGAPTAAEAQAQKTVAAVADKGIKSGRPREALEILAAGQDVHNADTEKARKLAEKVYERRLEAYKKSKDPAKRALGYDIDIMRTQNIVDAYDYHAGIVAAVDGAIAKLNKQVTDGEISEGDAAAKIATLEDKKGQSQKAIDGYTNAAGERISGLKERAEEARKKLEGLQNERKEIRINGKEVPNALVEAARALGAKPADLEDPMGFLMGKLADRDARTETLGKIGKRVALISLLAQIFLLLQGFKTGFGEKQGAGGAM